MKNLILVGIMILFFSACRQLENVLTPTDTPKLSITVTKIMTNPSVPVATSSPTELITTPTAVSATGLAPDELSKYVGLTYPPLPDGLSEGFGSVIGDSDFALSIASDNENKMLWLSRLTHHDASGKAFWKIKDIIKLPKLEGDVVLIPDGYLLNGNPDDKVIAIGEWDDEVFASRYMANEKILVAWKTNTDLGIFEELSTNGIECHADNAVELN